MKSLIFSTAWTMFRNGTFSTFAASLKAAWNKSKLQKVLRNGVAKFSFTKKDGTVRHTTGTTQSGAFEYEAKTTNGTRTESATIVKYYDLEKNAFRCLNIDTFIAFA